MSDMEAEQPVHIVPEVVERFEPDDPMLKEFLFENGFVVVKNVMNTTHIEEAKSKLWSFLEESAGMIYSDKSTWNTKNLEKIGLPDNGIICKDIGQTDFMWYIRLLPRIRTAFANVHGTADLLCSMDGCNIFLPWHKDESIADSKTECGWFHVDQGCDMRGFQCVQGLVTLTDVTAGTGGLCLIPKSSQSHDELVDLVGEKSNFVIVPPTFHALTQKQILPLCQSGDMILWDSRTIHCSTPALEFPTTSADELLRIAAYVCMTPRELANDDVLRNRMEAYMRNMSLHHWPHIITHNINIDDPIMRQYSNAPPEIRNLIA